MTIARGSAGWITKDISDKFPRKSEIHIFGYGEFQTYDELITDFFFRWISLHFVKGNQGEGKNNSYATTSWDILIESRILCLLSIVISDFSHISSSLLTSMSQNNIFDDLFLILSLFFILQTLMTVQIRRVRNNTRIFTLSVLTYTYWNILWTAHLLVQQVRKSVDISTTNDCTS